MTPDEVKYRHCSVPGCTYKELRGSRQGAFRDGKFICDTCYTEMPEPPSGDGQLTKTEK